MSERTGHDRRRYFGTKVADLGVIGVAARRQ
jgi:hypothetical protein